jgi:hypothetical protein
LNKERQGVCIVQDWDRTRDFSLVVILETMLLFQFVICKRLFVVIWPINQSDRDIAIDTWRIASEQGGIRVRIRRGQVKVTSV